VVSTSQPLAAQTGLLMLARGGNAVDAAIATAAAFTVVEPTGNGLGSDALAILWDGQELHGLNASGRSPAGWTPERFNGLASMPLHGWESVAVPEAVSGCRKKYTTSAHTPRITEKVMFTHLRTAHQIAAPGLGDQSNSSEFYSGLLGR
tara:strand:- start:232 stop:678 length:447 start_codon:yes stop_codon:yes gene_type:complete